MEPTERLQLFDRRVEELLAARLLKNFKPGFRLDFGAEKPLRSEVNEPDEDHLRSFFLTFRKLVSDGEPVFISGIHNILWQRLTTDSLKGALAEAHKEWRGRMRTGMLEFVVDDQKIRPEYVLDLWINGEYFHDDQIKKKELDRLLGVGLSFVRYMLLNAVVDTTQFAVILRNIYRQAAHEGSLNLA